jgi:phospholipase C
MNQCLNKAMAIAAAAALSLLPVTPAFANKDHGDTATPIKHIVVIFQENVSFDHYFGTYPNAKNPKGEPAFHARPGTPSVNGLQGALLTSNPNFLNTAGNGTDAATPSVWIARRRQHRTRITPTALSKPPYTLD